MSDPLWLLLGFAGQTCLSARFLIQWIASERRRRSIVPPAFWVLSLAGGLVILAYAIHRRDPVIIAGQTTGLFAYSRNLQLDLGRQGRRHARTPSRRRPGLETGTP